MKKIKNKNEVKVGKREKSGSQLLDALQAKYSKLCIVRVDLAYKKDKNGNVPVSFDEADRDFNRMLNNRRGKPSIFEHQVGYLCLKESTEQKGTHFHMALAFDGNKVKSGSYMGDKIGENWNNTTKGKGTYHNCHRNKYKYDGLGMLNHNDTKKREILDTHVLSYLYKDDVAQDITSVKTNDKDRAFVRSTMPKSKGKVGRPRK